MKNVFSLICLLITIFSSGYLQSQNIAIVADHLVVEEYNQIPQLYIDEVKKMLLSYLGESHAAGLFYGLQILEDYDNKFAFTPIWNGAPDSPSNNNLRVLRNHYSYRSSWDLGGEEDTWTHKEAINNINAFFQMQRNDNNPINAFVFGWCWDMSVSLDCQNGWAGLIYTDFQKSQSTSYWDLNSTNPNLQDYLDAWTDYEENNLDIAIIYSTGPVDGSGKTDCRGYQRWLKNNFIRDWVKHGEKKRYLFDYADILCWNDADQEHLESSDGYTFPAIHPDNEGNYDGGHGGCHISQAGTVRLAKAMWWLLARIAGWQDPSKIKIPKNIIPDKPKLGHNYPNPFNPSTKIKFSIPKPEHVKIEVYTIIGQKIEILLNKQMPVGYHEVNFNAKNLSSGIYLYKIEAGEFQDVKKMVLIN